MGGKIYQAAKVLPKHEVDPQGRLSEKQETGQVRLWQKYQAAEEAYMLTCYAKAFWDTTASSKGKECVTKADVHEAMKSASQRTHACG